MPIPTQQIQRDEHPCPQGDSKLEIKRPLIYALDRTVGVTLVFKFIFCLKGDTLHVHNKLLSLRVLTVEWNA